MGASRPGLAVAVVDQTGGGRGGVRKFPAGLAFQPCRLPLPAFMRPSAQFLAGLPARHPMATLGLLLAACLGLAANLAGVRMQTEITGLLPDDVILCPGHGPRTTVGAERAHNPFLR